MPKKATAPPRPVPGAAAAATERPDVVAQLQSVWSRAPFPIESVRTATFTFADAPGKPMEIRYLPNDASHERAFDRLMIDPATGSPSVEERYADKPIGARIAASIFPLHRGSYFGIAGIVVMMVASLLMPLLAVVGWMMYLDRRRRRLTAAEPLPDL